MSEDPKKDIWKQKELIDFLQQGLDLNVEGAGLEELGEAWMKLADLYNRDEDLSNAREAMKRAEDYGALIEAEHKAKVASSKSSRPGTSASSGAKSRPGTSASTGGRSRPGTSASTDGNRSMCSLANTGKINKTEEDKILLAQWRRRRT